MMKAIKTFGVLTASALFAVSVAETEIAAFEEVQGEPVDKTRRSFRHDRVN